MTKGLIVYGIAVALMVTSFFLPPMGIIDGSVLMGVGILLAGYQLMFGHSIKEITIDRNGVHIETHNKGEEDNETK